MAVPVADIPDTGAVEQGRRAGLPQAIVLLAATTLPIMGVISLIAVVPELLKHFAAVPGAAYLVPIALVAPGLCIALLSPVMGMVADRVGRRVLLLVALALYAIFGTMPLFVDQLPAIIATRFGLGVTEAIIMTITTTLTGDYFRAEERQTWIGAQTAIGSLSATALFLSGGALGRLGWQGPFYLYALAVPVFIAALVWLWEPTASATQLKSKNSATSPFPWRSIVGICVASLLCSIAFYAAPLQLGVRLSEIGVTDTGKIGVVAGLGSLGFPVGAILFRRIASPRMAGLLAAVLMMLGIGLVGIGAGQSVVVIGFAMFVNQIGSGALMPCLITWCLSKLVFEHRGQGAGLWTSAFFLGQFLSPLMMAALADHGRGTPFAFLLVGAVCLIAGLALASLRTRLSR